MDAPTESDELRWYRQRWAQIALAIASLMVTGGAGSYVGTSFERDKRVEGLAQRVVTVEAQIAVARATMQRLELAIHLVRVDLGKLLRDKGIEPTPMPDSHTENLGPLYSGDDLRGG